ncbi:MAG TPA: MFS transporter [Kofleriaceae bacterium]
MAVHRSTAWAVAVCATLTMTVSYFDRQTLAVLAPTVKQALGISSTAYGWLSSAFSIAYLVATPISGWWIDRVGARRGLVASVLLWTVAAALHAVVPGFWMLFALRIALGMTEGPSFPGSAQTVQRILPPHDRARGFGVLFTGSSIGGMLAPPLASALFDEWGWRIAFLGTALIGLIWVPIWLFWTSRPGVPAQLDHGDDAQSKPERPGLSVLLQHPALRRALCAIFAVAPIFGVALAWGAVYLDKTFHIKQADIGNYLWLPPIVFDVAAILFGHLASKQHRAEGAPPRMLFAVGMLLATTLVLLPWMGSAWNAVYLVSLAMAGGGIVYTLATADMLQHMPSGSVSLAAGLMAGSQSLALIIVNPLIGASVDHFGDFDVASIAVGLWVVPGCLVWLLWRVPRGQPEPEVATARARLKSPRS